MSIVKLSTGQAELISLIYHNVKNALEAAEVLMIDEEISRNMKYDVVKPIQVKLKWIKDGIEFKIPRERRDAFNVQLKHADTMRLNEINRLYTHMTIEKQEMLEKVAKGMVNGEILSVSVAEPEDNPF